MYVQLPRLVSRSPFLKNMASGSDEWGRILDGHPVFSPPNSIVKEESLELSLSSLSDFKHDEETDEGGTPSGRREVMCMKDSDLILACGSEIRMASLNDAKISGGSQRTYKVSAWFLLKLALAKSLRQHLDSTYTEHSFRHSSNSSKPQSKAACCCRGISGCSNRPS